MHELMYKEKYEPVKERTARGSKEHPRIREVIEEVEELQVTEVDNAKVQGKKRERVNFVISAL